METYKPGYYSQFFTNVLTNEPDYNIAIKHEDGHWEGYNEVTQTWESAPHYATEQIEFGFSVGMNQVEWISEL